MLTIGWRGWGGTEHTERLSRMSTSLLLTGPMECCQLQHWSTTSSCPAPPSLLGPCSCVPAETGWRPCPFDGALRCQCLHRDDVQDLGLPGQTSEHKTVVAGSASLWCNRKAGTVRGRSWEGPHNPLQRRLTCSRPAFLKRAAWESCWTKYLAEGGANVSHPQKCHPLPSMRIRS